jgi:hypothetical protein
MIRPTWAGVAGVALLGTVGVVGAVIVASPGGDEEVVQQVATATLRRHLPAVPLQVPRSRLYRLPPRRRTQRQALFLRIGPLTQTLRDCTPSNTQARGTSELAASAR